MSGAVEGGLRTIIQVSLVQILLLDGDPPWNAGPLLLRRGAALGLHLAWRGPALRHLLHVGLLLDDSGILLGVGHLRRGR